LVNSVARGYDFSQAVIEADYPPDLPDVTGISTGESGVVSFKAHVSKEDGINWCSNGAVTASTPCKYPDDVFEGLKFSALTGHEFCATLGGQTCLTMISSFEDLVQPLKDAGEGLWRTKSSWNRFNNGLGPRCGLTWADANQPSGKTKGSGLACAKDDDCETGMTCFVNTNEYEQDPCVGQEGCMWDKQDIQKKNQAGNIDPDRKEPSFGIFVPDPADSTPLPNANPNFIPDGGRRTCDERLVQKVAGSLKGINPDYFSHAVYCNVQCPVGTYHYDNKWSVSG
jgi:hypothetical protein